MTDGEAAELRRAVVDAHLSRAALRSELRRARMWMHNARGLLTPGLKAGVGEAKQLLDRGIAEVDDVLADAGHSNP